jgi:hypothetical protein
VLDPLWKAPVMSLPEVVGDPCNVHGGPLGHAVRRSLHRHHALQAIEVETRLNVRQGCDRIGAAPPNPGGRLGRWDDIYSFVRRMSSFRPTSSTRRSRSASISARGASDAVVMGARSDGGDRPCR